MAGGVVEQFNNLLKTLDWIQRNQPTPDEVRNWLINNFVLTTSFARDVYTVILISTGLVKVLNNRCRLTADGVSVLKTNSPSILLEVFEKSFIGVVAFLEVLRTKSMIKRDNLDELWLNTVKDRFPRLQNWSKRTLQNQCRHRTDWLQTMGFINYKDRLFSLTESGWDFVQKNPPEAFAIQKHELKTEEKELKGMVLDSFDPFSRSKEKVVTLRKSFTRDRAFRVIVTNQYEYHCVICGFKFRVPNGYHEAEAAHIVPKQKLGTDDPRNGICLCSTCHWLFDEGILSILAERYSVVVASYLKTVGNDFSVERVLSYKDKKIRPATNPKYSPAEEALLWHNEHIFLG
jgi:hypothetical protein